MLIDYPARFYGVTVLGVDEHCWRHTCGEAARTHRLTRGALHYEVHLAPHDVPHGGGTFCRSSTRTGLQAGSVAVGRPAGRSPGLAGRPLRRSTHGETELLARTRQPEDRLVLPKRVFGWVESAALVPVKLWLRRPIETARSSAITRVRLVGPPRRSS